MRVCVLLAVLVALAASAAAEQGQRAFADVVYTQPSLDLGLSDVIHPYAWSSQMPTPYYDAKINPYELDDKALSAFLDVQTHVKSDSAAARSLVEVATTVDAKKGILKKIGKGIGRGLRAVGRGVVGVARAFGEGLFGRRSRASANPKGISVRLGRSRLNNPATYATRPLKPVPSDFLKNPRTSTGSFPGAQHSRRGTYGVRRRRIPYYSSKEGFGSANPFRQPNNFFNSPNDVMLPRTDKRSPIYAATHPGFFDVGSNPDAPLPYGGYSSFRRHRFRASRNQAYASPGSPSAPGANNKFLSDGSPTFPKDEDAPHTLPGNAPRAPRFPEPSPYIGGEFQDFYGGGAAAGGAEGGSEGGF